MLAVVFAKSLFAFLVVVGLLAPVVAWLGRERRAPWQLVAAAIALASRPDSAAPAAARDGGPWLHRLAPGLGLVAVVSAFAVIPFAGHYRFGQRFELSAVAADVEWGVLWALAAWSLAGCCSVVAGWSSARAGSRLGALRALAQLLSWPLAMGLTLVPMFMIFGSVELPAIGLAQDSRVQAFAWLRVIGGSEWPLWLSLPTLPGWGLLLNPPAGVMFLSCAMAAAQRPPFDAPRADRELLTGWAGGYSGLRLAAVSLAGALQVVLAAALVTAIFLGGWTLPWLPQTSIEAALARFFGAALAAILCLLLHMGVFLSKVVAVIWLQLRIGELLPRQRVEQTLDLCWKVILPWSLVNIFVTALALLALEAA